MTTRRLARFARFARLARLAPLAVALGAAGVTAAACASKPGGAAFDAGPAAAPEFTLLPPPGWRPVAASGPVVASYEGPTYPNGFTPTMHVTTRPLRGKAAHEALYADWRKTMLDALERDHDDVQVVNEATLRGGAGQEGKLIVAFVSLPRPGKLPLPLFAYGALYLTPGRMWAIAALTASELDAATGKASPLGETEMLRALTSFQPR